MTINEQAMLDLLDLMEAEICRLKSSEGQKRDEEIRAITDIGVTIARLSESNRPGETEAPPVERINDASAELEELRNAR